MLQQLLDSDRFLNRKKLDFCRTVAPELIEMVNEVNKKDSLSESRFKPLVAIGLTKGVVVMKGVDFFLDYFDLHRILVSTLGRVYQRCTCEVCCTEFSTSEALIRHV